MTGQNVYALSILAVTITLALTRPHIGRRLVVGPALAALTGVLMMSLSGYVAAADVREAISTLWRPLIAVASIMVIAAAAEHLGVIDRLAAAVLPMAGASPARLFLLVFVLSALTAAILNNDTAILVLTPTVVALVRRLYPQRPNFLAPNCLAVFMAAGVAPLATSNPMNLIVADFAGLDFNAYLVWMLPVALVSSVATFLTLRWVFWHDLVMPARAESIAGYLSTGPWRPAERQGLLLILAVLCAYPVVDYFGGSVWVVALAGAAAAAWLVARWRVATPRQLVANGVSWQVLLFLLGLFVIVIGLRNAGAVDWLSATYASANVATIGVISALGSALFNNHSMALANLLALESLPGPRATREYLAILIGGDLGPRLLPTGSLAGLMWYAVLERLGVRIPLRQFVTIGAITTVPSLGIALALLLVMS